MSGIKILLWLALVVSIFPVQAEETSISGKTIFEARCGGLCHQLPEADMLNARQWKRVLHTMQKRMQQRGMGSLTDQEFTAVLEYLVSQGKK